MLLEGGVSTDRERVPDGDRQTVIERDGVARRRARDFDGLTVAEAERLAESLGLTLRVIAPGQWRTDDYRLGRVTAQLKDGRLTDASAG
ncbi:hypothetical protein M6B22_14320 [Jatrophihabitans cynanchi]|uniref:Uncharacterized protein n=1 Tax=Jatrophihabitans cynanchi TaxID=2944128 RepID=A0ABY7JT15_9ACTN|nr:hypothetical protein [Jatrophihabitans sp. SB3-54]WAX55707.1 hypothetical protein M6B22_14320 [Jatrophihabitans sp. SB3-54]